MPESKVSNLDVLADVEVEVSLRFGRVHLPLRTILSLGSGSIVALEEPLHTPVEMRCGQKVVALGEVVALDGNYGFRVTAAGNSSPRPQLEER